MLKILQARLQQYMNCKLPDVQASFRKRQRASLVAQSVKNLPAVQETRVQSLGWEDPLEKEWQPTPVSLPGKSHGQRNLVDFSPWGRKESGTTERLTHITEESEIKLPTSAGSLKKQESSRKTSIFALLTMPKPFDCVDHNKLWKILKEMGMPVLLRNLYAGQDATVRTGHETAD